MEHIKTWLPVVLALIAGAYALERRLAAIEKSVAVIEWRMNQQHGVPEWERP